MNTLTYKEITQANDIEKLETLLKELPAFCTDFYNQRSVRLLPKTLLNYAQKMQTFLKYLHDYGDPAFKTKNISQYLISDMKLVSTLTIASFLAFVRSGNTNPNNERKQALNGKYVQRNNKRSTEDNYLACIGAYYSFWQKNGLVANNPVKGIERSKRSSEHNIVHLSHQNKQDLLDSVKTGNGLTKKEFRAWDRNALREQCIITLLLDTGIRVSELVGLNLTDIDLDECCLRVQRKGDHPDEVYFSDATALLLADYIEFRKEDIYALDKDALFLTSVGTYKGQRLGVRSVEKLVKKYAQAAGVQNLDKISTHKLRSTYAMDMLEAHGNLSLVQQQLGHKSINATVLYAQASTKEKKQHRNDLN